VRQRQRSSVHCLPPHLLLILLLLHLQRQARSKGAGALLPLNAL
jgi:hypothetical protein